MNCFNFRNLQLSLFEHSYNCGSVKGRMTERSVELSITDYWLNSIGDISGVVEIGAVTPYYWPNRVQRVIDPSDNHNLVTDKKSFFDVDLKGLTCLSISTFEHIGTSDYRLKQNTNLVIDAFNKLFEESPEFLVTVPTGYNNICDGFLTNLVIKNKDIEISCLERNTKDNDWKETSVKIVPYCNFANGLLIITKKWKRV